MNAPHTQQKDSYESFEVKNEMKGKEYVGVILFCTLDNLFGSIWSQK